MSIPAPGVFRLADPDGRERSFRLGRDGRVWRLHSGNRQGRQVVAYWNPGGMRETGNASPAERVLLERLANDPEGFRGDWSGPCYNPACDRWVGDLRVHTCAKDRKRGAA